MQGAPEKMCNKTKDIEVYIVPRLHHTGQGNRRVCKIDACIADIVEALDDAGIVMTHSCCGHNKNNGDILLEDGRKLVIVHKK